MADDGGMYEDEDEIRDRIKREARRQLLGPMAWMIYYACGCEIPCRVRVTDTYCPKHDFDGPVVRQRPMFFAPTET